MIAAWHSHVTEYELRRECQIKSDEDYEGGKTSPTFRIHAAADLGPPIVQATKISQQRSADHDVGKMRTDEIGVAEVNVRRQCRQKHARQSADRDQADEPKAINHRRLLRE